MRSFVLPLALALSSGLSAQTQTAPSSPPGPAPTASSGAVNIQGTVLNAITGKPLEGVHVMLIAYGPENFPAVIYGAMSRADGGFSILQVPPQSYSIQLERRGFVFVGGAKAGSAAGGVLKLTAASPPIDLTLEMAPQATITGRILDEYGDPVADVMVSVQPQTPEIIEHFTSLVRTNDQGEFRLAVAPGKYNIAAHIWRHGSGPAEVRTDGTVEADYVETYYPSATTIETAEVIEARPGSERSGVEIRLARSPILSISGAVDGVPAGVPFVSIRSEGGSLFADLGVDFVSGSGTGEYKFQLGHLRSGTYRVYAQCNCSGREMQSQAVEVALTDSNVASINLTLAPGADVVGTIVPAPHGAGQTLRLHPVGSRNFDRLRAAEVAADGTFTIKDVFAERYHVQVEGLAENGFVKTIQVNGEPVPNEMLDFSSGAEGARLKIIISPNGGQITGQVYVQQGVPAPFAAVIVFPDRDDLMDDQVHSLLASADGAYSFKGLAPGRYRLLALNPTAEWFSSMEAAVRKQRGSAETIEIKEGEKAAMDIKIGGREVGSGSQE